MCDPELNPDLREKMLQRTFTSKEEKRVPGFKTGRDTLQKGTLII